MFIEYINGHYLYTMCIIIGYAEAAPKRSQESLRFEQNYAAGIRANCNTKYIATSNCNCELVKVQVYSI